MTNMPRELIRASGNGTIAASVGAGAFV